jgi:hypothetical protein
MSDTSGSAQHSEAAPVKSAPEQMTDRMSGNPQRVPAAVAYAPPKSSRNDKAGACTALPNGGGIAPTTKRAKRVSFTVSQSC